MSPPVLLVAVMGQQLGLASPHQEASLGFRSLSAAMRAFSFPPGLGGTGMGQHGANLPVVSHERQKYTCPKCQIQYMSLTVFERHLRKCDGVNPLVCRICRRVFSQACAVKEHMRGFHGIGEKVACRYCGKPFKYKTSLYTHSCEEKEKHQKKEEEAKDAAAKL